MAGILVIGSSNTDMVVRVERFPKPGETLLGGEFFMFPGGKGANQAVAAARLGGDVAFVCKLGEDVFGQKALKGWAKEGIRTEGIVTDPSRPSGVALITVDSKGENEIVVAPGANGTLSPQDISKADPALRDAGVVLTQLEIPRDTVTFVCDECRKHKKKLILNPAPAQRLEESVFKDLFLLTPNEGETEVLTGITIRSDSDLSEAAIFLLNRGLKNVAITLGARGVYFHSEKEQFVVNAPRVTPVDTTAAGDVFNGALAVALVEGKPWKPALEFAVKAASLSVTRLGAQTSAPYRRELD